MENSHPKLNFLVIEREAKTDSSVTEQIRRNPTLEMTAESVSSVEEALRVLKEKPFDMLVMDLDQPSEKGLEVYRRLNEANVHLPFVLLTSVQDDALVREAIRLGIADVLVKNQNQFDRMAALLRGACEKFNAPAGGTSLEPQPMSPGPAGPLSNERPAEPPDLSSHVRDELTGLYAHSYMHERIAVEFSSAQRYRYPLSCIMIDVDHFKLINEEEGYPVGDQLLKEIGGFLFENCRLSDLVSRNGGEEFLVVLPHIDYEHAFQLAKRLRILFSEKTFLAESRRLHLTVSIGVTCFPDDAMGRRSDLVQFAREALLNAKVNGRNRCVLYREIKKEMNPHLPKFQMSEKKIVEFQRRISELAAATRRHYLQGSRDLLDALESRDRFTAGHGASCAKYAKQIANALGMSAEEAEIVENGALLHDIGKICIPDEVLLKPGRLDEHEYEIIKEHTYFGYQILRPIKFLREEALIVLHHHEHFNGNGYPSRLKGEEIPLGARIVSIVDAFDTIRMAGGRYKKTMPIENAVQELIRVAGAQFDPKIVKVFIQVLINRGEVAASAVDLDRLENKVKSTDLLGPQSGGYFD
ncbi:MAG: diguanylate cyclase [Candidatus Omnitrophota bacterium]